MSCEAQTPSLRGTAPVTVLSFILFLSGIGALIFETLWLRLSGLAFGNSVWAAALILSSFMAGLALGNAIAASSRIRRWRPLHLYALLEVLVACLAAQLFLVFRCLANCCDPYGKCSGIISPTLLGLRFIVSFLILLVPTTAMGLTLPVLIEDPMLRQTNFGRAIGFLYGSNTLGAVAGAVLGEGYLIASIWSSRHWFSCRLGGLHCRSGRIADNEIDRSDRRLFLSEHFLCVLTQDIGPRGVCFSSALGRAASFLSLEVIWFRFLRLYVARRRLHSR